MANQDCIIKTFIFLLTYCLLQTISIEAAASVPDSVSDTTVLAITSSDTIQGQFDSIPEIPKLITFVKAYYPKDLIDSGIEGSVILDLLIDTIGAVDSVAVVKGVNPQLDSAAVKAALGFHFLPARLKNQPIDVILQYAYHFSIIEQMVEFQERINLSGHLLEKGTKKPLSFAIVALNFSDTTAKTAGARKTDTPPLESLPNGIPLTNYLQKIGMLSGQQFEAGQLITKSDSTGHFRFKSLPCGTIRIRVIAVNHKLYNDRVVIQPDKATDMTLYIANESYNQYETVVYGKAQTTEIQEHVISGTEIRKIPGFNGEAVKVVQALPGLARPKWGQNELNIRGADNDQSKVILDGIELPYLYHIATWDMMMYRSIINSDVLRSVKLYPGGIGIRYGDVLGGVVDLSSRPARTDRLHGTVDINLKGYSILVESPIINNLSAIGSLRCDLSSLVQDFIYTRVLHKPLFIKKFNYDYLIRLDYTPSSAHRIFIESIGASDTIASPSFDEFTNRIVMNGQMVNFESKKFFQGIAGWDWNINSSLVNELRLGARRGFSFNETREMPSYWSDKKETTINIRDEFTNTVSDHLVFTSGVDVRLTPYQESNISNWNDTTINNSIDLTLGHLGFYIFSNWRPVPKLTLTPGIRYDWFPAINSSGTYLPEFWNYKKISNATSISGNPSLRLSSRYDFNKSQSITASAGTYTQSIDSIVIANISDTKLPVSKGSQYTIGYSWIPANLLSLSIEGYYNQQWDLPFGYKEYQGKKRMPGLELMLRLNPGRSFSGWVSYSVGYLQQYFPQENRWKLDDYNILNNIQLVGSWAMPLENALGFHIQYTDGYPYTPQVLQYYDATSFEYIKANGETNSKRFPPFIGIDLSYSKKLVLKKSCITTYIELIRILHLLQYIKQEDGSPVYKPSESYQYNYDATDFEGQAIFPMASLGLTWEF